MSSNVRKIMHFDTEEWFYGQKAYVAVVKAEHENIAKQYFSKFTMLYFLLIKIYNITQLFCVLIQHQMQQLS